MFTKKEIALIKILAQNPDGLCKDTLLQTVFGYGQNTSTHTLATHVWRLRRKIEENARKPQILVTIDGGYRLIVDKTLPCQDIWLAFCIAHEIVTETGHD